MAASLAINHGESMRAERAKVAGSAPAVSQQQPTVAQERVLAIRRHVDGLPERQRLAVLMHKYQGFDYRQVAEVLGISESATKLLLFEAYETLRGKLGQFI
jgi:RNA polymerase sigma-70 factor, ECF subfamily